ncbi:hypothetical protein DLAC_04134 [Tieghemostelium lacteum]|uniref:Blue (type 1) copper domain-containing protein n=1 Tax=Tieghemostelium lacteum TaxID=361077 RepID=A0A151ZSB3_TIELA|nr:hypothetical protein DLAC_04134 [Tieghemostelium lacteum]|eukprot:KYQ96828.1 hypothetical protein DLAC_04134 [Tieghemostelium lacteum]
MKLLLTILIVAVALSAVKSVKVDVPWNQNDFPKESVKVQVGDIINFVVTDGDNHSIKYVSQPKGVTPYESNKFNGNFTHIFGDAGEYQIQCTVHDNMKADFIVSPKPTEAPTTEPPKAVSNEPEVTKEPVKEENSNISSLVSVNFFVILSLLLLSLF